MDSASTAKARGPARKAAALPCIIIAAYSTEETARKALKLGAVDYIPKPFEDIDDIRLRILHALASKRTEYRRAKYTLK